MTKRREILLLIPRMAGGGAERVMGLLADGFNAAGWETTLMLTSQRTEDMVGYRLSEGSHVCSMVNREPVDSPIESLKYFWMKNNSRLWGSFCELFKIRMADKLAYETFLAQYHSKVKFFRNYLLKHPQTSIIAFLQPAVNIALLANDGLPNRLIISERADPARYSLNRYMPYFAQKWYTKAYKIVFQTESAQACFPADIIDKSTVIYNPLNPSLPEPHEGKRRKVIVNFCRLTSQKNLPLLVDAFVMFHKSHPEYRLQIWGEGEAERDIRNYISYVRQDEFITLHPFDATLHQSIKDCAMFVSSSDYEGMSNSMLEALAIGLPCVCTDCPAGGARAIIKDHVNGLLVPIKDKTALYNAMSELIDNPELASKLSVNAVKLKTQLSQDKIVDKWIELMECAD